MEVAVTRARSPVPIQGIPREAPPPGGVRGSLARTACGHREAPRPVWRAGLLVIGPLRARWAAGGVLAAVHRSDSELMPPVMPTGLRRVRP